jgi:hypothetical protein
MSFSLLIGRHLGLILFPFPLTPAQLPVLFDDLLIKECAANITLVFVTHQYNGAANQVAPDDLRIE